MKRFNITLAQIQAFVTVVDAGSFTVASERLGMTQSAVSHAVATLEKELQVSLLKRDRRGIFLTEIGKRVLVQARSILNSTEQIRQETAAAIGFETGKVRIGSFPSVSARFLPGLLRQFQLRYPGIEVVLFEGTDDEVQEWVYAHTIDIGVVTLPVERLKTLSIAQDRFVAVVADSHPLAKQQSIHIRQLAQEPFIMSKAGCEPVIKRMFRQSKVTPKIQCEVIDLRTIFAMVKQEIGVTIVPEMALPADLAGLQVLTLQPEVRRQLALAIPSLDATPAVREFLNLAQTWIQDQ